MNLQTVYFQIVKAEKTCTGKKFYISLPKLSKLLIYISNKIWDILKIYLFVYMLMSREGNDY